MNVCRRIYRRILKKTLFGLFSSIAYSDSAKAKLYQIWNKEVVIPGLKLNEDDFTNMAMNLAIFKHEKADEILEKTRTTITNPDKRNDLNSCFHHYQKRNQFEMPLWNL